MNDFNEVTAENLRRVRGSRGMNQEALAELLGVEKYSISRIENGSRALSGSEKSLLDWYFFGHLPPRLANSLDLPDVLEFTDDEWRIVRILAARAGQTPEQWIASTIRVHLQIEQHNEKKGMRAAEPPPHYPKNGTEEK